jgi:predicted HTH transcriptional regulator
MIERAIEAIDEALLAALISNKVAERRDLEFKRDRPGGSDGDIKEFLADVTSLANAQGGDLIFGIEDVGGVAVALPGIAVADADGGCCQIYGAEAKN